MNTQELQEKIIAFLKEHMETELEKIDENSQLIADLGFSSLDVMVIVNDAEDEFGIVIDDEEMKKITTVGDVFKIVESKKRG